MRIELKINNGHGKKQQLARLCFYHDYPHPAGREITLDNVAGALDQIVAGIRGDDQPLKLKGHTFATECRPVIANAVALLATKLPLAQSQFLDIPVNTKA